jgi:hypothetical protein
MFNRCSRQQDRILIHPTLRAASLVADKKFHDAFYLLTEMYTAVEEAKRCASPGGELAREAELLERDMLSSKGIAEAMRDIESGDRQVEEAVKGEKNLNPEAIDCYTQAMALGRGQDIEVMCIAFTKVANIYLKIMKDPISIIKGKQNLNEVMELAKVGLRLCCFAIG